MILPAWPPSARVLCPDLDDPPSRSVRLCMPHPDEVGATMGAGPTQTGDVAPNMTNLTQAKAHAEAAMARSRGATPGPWRSVWEDDSAAHQVGPSAQVAIYSQADGLTPDDRAWGVVSTFHDDTCDGPMPAVNRPNAAFIAEARTDVPALAADVLALAEEVERLRTENVSLRVLHEEAIAACLVVAVESNDEVAAGAAMACARRIGALAAKPVAPAMATHDLQPSADTTQPDEAGPKVSTWPVGVGATAARYRTVPQGEPCTHGVPGGCEVRCVCSHLCRRHHAGGCDATIDTGGDETDLCPCLDFEAAGGEG